jgi:hypothetical protein
MNVQIVSIQAALHGAPSILWHGTVERDELAALMTQPPRMTHEAINEALFRYFNRVDDEDSERLHQIGFELPSLSVGDLIHWGSVTYRVAGSGFEKITDSSEYVMALTAYALRSSDPEEEETG